MMKSPFKKDIGAIRRQVLEETSKAASVLASLRSKRQAALIDSDLAAIEEIDSAISGAERRVSILQERLAALSEQLKVERSEQRESDRDAAVKIIEKKLAVRETLAVKLEAAIKDVGDLYFELTGYPSPLLSDWPWALPPGAGRIDINGINREVSLALFSASRPIEGRPRMPSASSLDSGVVGIKSETISGVVSRQNKNLIELLQVVTIGRDDEAGENAA
jgi:hypothetical protein